jgi:hypothetical protein
MSHEEKPPSGCMVLIIVLYAVISAPIILGILNILGIPLVAGNAAIACAAVNKYFYYKNKR